MTDKVGTIRFLTVAPGPGPSEAIPDDSVLNREPPETYRALGDGEEPNRQNELDEAAPPSLDTQLLDHVWRIAQGAARLSDALMQLECEYSLPQILVLRAIVAAEQTARHPLCASEVADELQCSRPNVTALVATLVRRRALTTRRDPANRRVVRLYPTPTGRLTEFHAREQLAIDASRAFVTLASGEKEMLLALLQKVASLP